MSTDRLTVMLCCNDEYGTPSGLVDQISADELIQLEGPIDFDRLDLPGVTPFEWCIDGWFRVGATSYRHHGRGRHVGNMHWDSVEMDPAEFARLLNNLMATKEWGCDEAEESLFELWGKGEPITVEALRRAIEA